MNRIFRKVAEHEIISFDIYETLICRYYSHPKRVFEIVDKVYRERYGSRGSINNFSKKRSDVEGKLRKENKNGEVKLDEIYASLERENKEWNVQLYKDLEKELEMSSCIARTDMLKIYDYCVRSGKRIILVSDMYLPKEHIERILFKCGIKGYDKIYISCEYGCSKMSGDLYRTVIEEERVQPNAILHFGDDYKSDYINAKHYKLSAVWKKPITKVSESDIENECFKNMINLRTNKSDFFYDLGYSSFGPFVYGFIRWIINECTSLQIEKLLFLSRDGYFMHKVFELIKDDKGLSGYYFYGSRKALNIPTLHFASGYEDIRKTMFIPSRFSVRWLLNSWGLKLEKCKDALDKAGITTNEVISKNEVINNPKLEKLYLLLKDEINDNSIKEYEALKCYIDEIGIEEKTALIDIGWHGNMQQSLQKILEKKGHGTKLFGYYVGVDPNSKIQDKLNMKGFLYQKGKREKWFNSLKYTNTVLELFFMAPHGTTDGYAEKGKKYEVRIKRNEYAGSKTEKKIKNMQDGALQFVIDFHNACGRYSNSSNIKFEMNMCNRLLKPDLKSANEIGDLSFYEDGWKKLAPNRGLSSRAFIKSFAECPWKIGFLKRAFVIPIRYDYIVALVRLILLRLRDGKNEESKS